MTDRVYPSSKPPASSLNPNPSNTAPKPNLYRPQVYRPTPPKRRRGNRCCLCCIWSTIFILSIILLAAIAACILYVLYRPHPPAFTVSSIRFSSFNLTSSNLNSKLNISVTARNPNKNLVFFYDPISVSVFSDGVDIGDGSFPAFVHEKKNSTVMRALVSTGGPRDLDPDAVKSVSAGTKKKGGLPLDMKVKVKVKMGGLKRKKVGVRVHCAGITAVMPKGKSAAPAASAADSDNTKCKVKIRVKIWKWEL